MYVVIFKGTAPCPLLHIQVMQDKQHIKKAHMCWVGVVHYHTPASTTLVDLTVFYSA